MSTWVLVQVFLNLFFLGSVFVLSMRLLRAPKDDPRLSRGLQLLQSKISVLEDLSDKTEHQVQQLCAILDQKARELQNKIQAAEKHVQLIRVSMDKSLEVAQIFEDKIPHHEIIERKNTKKYIDAARLAHSGKSVEEISQLIDLPRGELEFITKINRDQLMFQEEQLPAWAMTEDRGNSDGYEVTNTSGSRSEKGFTTAQELVTNFASNSGYGPGEPSGYDVGLQIAQEMGLVSEHQNMMHGLKQIQDEMDQFDRNQRPTHAMSSAFQAPEVNLQSLSRLGEEFRRAVHEFDLPEKPTPSSPSAQASAPLSLQVTAPLSAAEQEDQDQLNRTVIRSQSDLAALLDEARYNLGQRRQSPKPMITESEVMPHVVPVEANQGIDKSTPISEPNLEPTPAQQMQTQTLQIQAAQTLAPQTQQSEPIAAVKSEAAVPMSASMQSPTVQQNQKSQLMAAKEVARQILQEQLPKQAPNRNQLTTAQQSKVIRPQTSAPRIFTGRKTSLAADPVVRKVEFPKLKM